MTGFEMVGDLTDRLAGEHLGVLVRLVDGRSVVGPFRRDGGDADVLEDGPPPIPAAGAQPQTMDEHHRGDVRTRSRR
jgi:hypothetical protein